MCALRYTVATNNDELAEIAGLIAMVKPRVRRFSADSSLRGVSSVEQGHSVGKVVLKVA